MAAPLVYDIGLLPFGQMTAPRIVGAGVEGGSSLDGISIASDASGGGLVAFDLANIELDNLTPSRMRAFNRFAAALASGMRSIIVPLLTDFYCPVPIGVDDYVLEPFSDTTPFSDTSEWSQDPVAGTVIAGAQSNAGTVTISVVGGTGVLEGGEIFGLNHLGTDVTYRDPAGYRAYFVTDIDSQTVDGNGNNIYTVGIRPTLRDAIPAGSPVTWFRPKCTFRLAPGFTADFTVQPRWFSTPSLKFIEAF